MCTQKETKAKPKSSLLAFVSIQLAIYQIASIVSQIVLVLVNRVLSNAS